MQAPVILCVRPGASPNVEGLELRHPVAILNLQPRITDRGQWPGTAGPAAAGPAPHHLNSKFRASPFIGSVAMTDRRLRIFNRRKRREQRVEPTRHLTTNNLNSTNRSKITLAQDSSLTEPQGPQRRASEKLTSAKKTRRKVRGSRG
jgi:hypothetical protein